LTYQNFSGCFSLSLTNFKKGGIKRAEEKAGRFPDPHEFEAPPELEGWEEMYPSQYLFSKDREKWEKSQFWYQHKIHDPEPMSSLDLILHEAWQMFLS